MAYQCFSALCCGPIHVWILESCRDAVRPLFWPQVGFDYVANAAEEAKNPAKDLPWGIVGSLGIATLLYVLMSLCIVSGWLLISVPLLPDTCPSNAIGSQAAAACMPCRETAVNRSGLTQTQTYPLPTRRRS